MRLKSARPSRVDLRVDQSLDNGHSSLGELLLGVSTGSVGNVDGMVDIDVVGKGYVLDLDAVESASFLCDLSVFPISSPSLIHLFRPPHSRHPSTSKSSCLSSLFILFLPQISHDQNADSLVRIPFSEELDGTLVGDLLNVGGESESHDCR